MDAEAIAELVAEGAKLDDKKAAIELRLKEIKAALLPLGEGDYAGGDRIAKVIVPASTIKPDPNKIPEVRALIDDEPVFKRLFRFVSGYKPEKDFRARVLGSLPPAKAQKVISLCEIPGVPYVIFK